MVNKLLLYGIPVLGDPTKVYILRTQESTEKMSKKWIKAIFTKPLVLLKSIIYRIRGKNEDLFRKRYVICSKCQHKLSTSVGEVCEECGCIIANKARIEDEHCDLCKW